MILPRLVQRLKRHHNRALEMIQSTGELRVGSPLLQVDARGTMQRRLAMRFIPAQPANAGAGTLSYAPPPEASPSFGWTAPSDVAATYPPDAGFFSSSPMGNGLIPGAGVPTGGYEGPAPVRMPAPLQHPTPTYSESYPPSAPFSPPAAPMAAPRTRELPKYPASPVQNVPDGEAPAARTVTPAQQVSARTAPPAASPGAPAPALPGPGARPTPAPAPPKNSPQAWAQRLRRHALAELGIFEPLPPPPEPEPVSIHAPIAPAVAPAEAPAEAPAVVSFHVPPHHPARTAPSEGAAPLTVEPSSSASTLGPVTAPAGSELAPSQTWETPSFPAELTATPSARASFRETKPAEQELEPVTALSPTLETVTRRAAPPELSVDASAAETFTPQPGAPQPGAPIEMRVARRPAHLQRPAPAPRAAEAPSTSAAAPVSPAQGAPQPVEMPTSSSTASSPTPHVSSVPLPSVSPSEAPSDMALPEMPGELSSEAAPDLAPLIPEATSPTSKNLAALARRLFAAVPALTETEAPTSAAPAEAQYAHSPAASTAPVEPTPAPQQSAAPASPTASVESASASAPQRPAATQQRPVTPEPRTAPVEQRSASAGNRPAPSDRSPQSWLERIKNSIRAEEARLAAQRQGPTTARLPQSPAMPETAAAARPVPLERTAPVTPERFPASQAVQQTASFSSPLSTPRVLAAEPSALSGGNPSGATSSPSATLAAFLAGAPRPFAAPLPQAALGETTPRPAMGLSSVQAAGVLNLDPRGRELSPALTGVQAPQVEATSRVQLSEATRRSLGLPVSAPSMPSLQTEPLKPQPVRSEAMDAAGNSPEAFLNQSALVPTAYVQPTLSTPPSADVLSPAQTAAPLLSPEVRLQLEQLTGVDPWTVPIIAGSEGAAMAAAYGAEAVSVHGAVYVGIQESLNSPRGLSLLAHELTHVARARQAEQQAASSGSHSFVPPSRGGLPTAPRQPAISPATPTILSASAPMIAAEKGSEGLTSSALPAFLSNPGSFPASAPSVSAQATLSGGEAGIFSASTGGVSALPPVEQDPVEEGFARRSEQLARRLAERTSRRTQRAPLVGLEGEQLFLPGQAGALVGAPALSPEALAWLEDDGSSSAEEKSAPGASSSNLPAGAWSRQETFSPSQSGTYSEPATGSAELRGPGLLSRTTRQQDAWGGLPAPWEPLPTWVTTPSTLPTMELSQAGIRSFGQAEPASAGPVSAHVGMRTSAATSPAAPFSSPTGAGSVVSPSPAPSSAGANFGSFTSAGTSAGTSASAGVARLAEPAAQEADSGGGEPAASSASPPEEAGGAEPNIDAIARQVYERIKRRLQEEVRRSR
ncbi:MAG: DUF4157 domain-containing protein [Myxococcota bacterium]